MIQGKITLKNGKEIEINEDILVRDGLSFSMSTSSGGRFDVGTFNAAELRISIYDEEASGHEFDASVISLSDVDEDVENLLGTYYVDGTKTDRRNRLVKLVAYDAATLFDIEIDQEFIISENALVFYTPEQLVSAASTAAGVPAESLPSDLPNLSVSSLSLLQKAVQTWRDAIMWTAQLVCANAVINRYGKLEFRRAKYVSNGDEIKTDHKIDGDQRISIRFSDVRTYIKHLTAYESERKPVSYTSSYTSTDEQARPAEFDLPANPILYTTDSTMVRSINMSWLSYIDGFKQREIKAELFGNPKIQLGDTCRFSGGTIDVRRSIVGVVTDIKIKHNGATTVICRAPEAVV